MIRKADAPALMLRRDLDIKVIEEHDAAFVSIIVGDPLRGSFFKLSWPESAMLLAWREATDSAGVAARVRRMFGIEVTDGDIKGVVSFAHANDLVEAHEGAIWRVLAAKSARRRESLAARLLHSYLFFRLPLARPDQHLRRIAPSLAWLYGAAFWSALGLTALVAIYLALRQWDALLSDLVASVSMQAVPVYGAAVLGLKVIHECGHALTAARYGCRVPSMGIAVMLGAPVLYTDVSDSWRLARRSDRLKVVVAGVAAEAIVAVAALLGWSLLADGLARQMCLAIASSAIILSVLVNLNPLMRFDGYFALSDWWRVPNLQARAFDLGLWQLRELLFSLGRQPPELVETRLRNKLIFYAWAVAIYRLFLFLGIAAMLLYAFGKAIGLVLATIEIGVFIAAPIGRELKEWWDMRKEIVSSRRSRATVMVCVMLSIAVLAPWITTVQAPAVILAEREEPLYLAYPARLTFVGVRDRQQVKAGDVLFQARSPELERELAKADLRVVQLKQQIERWHASGREREIRVVIESQLAAAIEKADGIRRRIAQLTITAPFEGHVVDLDPGTEPGHWFAPTTAVARVINNGSVRARAILPDGDVARIRPGSVATFISDDPTRGAVNLTLFSVLSTNDGRLSEPALAERHGGGVPTGGPRGDQMARQSGFELTLVGREAGPPHLVRGVVSIEAEAISPLRVLWRAIGRVLVREQGF